MNTSALVLTIATICGTIQYKQKKMDMVAKWIQSHHFQYLPVDILKVVGSMEQRVSGLDTKPWHAW